MATETINCAVDRIEEGTAVLIPDDGSAPFEISAGSLTGLTEGAAYTAVFEDGRLISLQPKQCGTKNAARLKNLFDKSNDISKR